MPDPDPASLFPLPLTPFEYYYLLEDRPDYPSEFPIRLDCRGPLDRAALARALRLTHQRHPFLSAKIEKDRRDWPFWIVGELPEIRWVDEANGKTNEASAVALSPGLRLRVRQDGENTSWEFAFHHVAVDGMGAFLFIADLFVAYAHDCARNPGPPPWRPLDPERLRARDGHQLFKQRVKLIDLWRIVRTAVPLNHRRVAVVINRDPVALESAGTDLAPTDLVHHLTEHETAELSRAAGASSVMLNDLLLRDYFVTLANWNRGTTEARRPIRVLVPTNMRRREDYRMPAANVFSFTFLTRRIRDCENRETLLASIRDEMAKIKQQKRGLYFEAGLRILCLWPPLLRFSLQRSWTFATAIFTNLGTGLDNVPLPERNGLRVCGDLVFEGGSGAGPIRPETRVSFAVHTYAGRMAICVRCDSRLFSAAEQQALLDAYLDQLRMTIAEAPRDTYESTGKLTAL